MSSVQRCPLLRGSTVSVYDYSGAQATKWLMIYKIFFSSVLHVLEKEYGDFPAPAAFRSYGVKHE